MTGYAATEFRISCSNKQHAARNHRPCSIKSVIESMTSVYDLSVLQDVFHISAAASSSRVREGAFNHSGDSKRFHSRPSLRQRQWVCQVRIPFTP
jgi:hypothetical protein